MHVDWKAQFLTYFRSLCVCCFFFTIIADRGTLIDDKC
uniref:Uncharacterized protein n=1 Tax=Lepeophtheirus salmonis TaxID=72036 RepID=A0A0K2TGI1_LEPSM